ncbi:putative cyclin-D6-1 isoform X2 [Abrus precatorius]|uniref:B-like cyclin n=1 Tax=Abrus precatorius TaxID=3816 RepID=A0A8B8K6S6_ABRPR|nr:putative cyclin-D6-1 isoform X2 [Abrus precatorius]
MEFDLEDPLAIFREEQNFSISELFVSESDHMPLPNCLCSTPFHVSFRCEAMSLILQVQLSCNLDPFVAYLAINYLQRFMSSQEIPGKPWFLRLLVISCISLASKMNNKTFSFSDMKKEGCNFEAQSIQNMEHLILGALKWRMRSITPFSFLNFFISLDEIKDQSLQQALKERASEIIFNAQNADIKLLEYKPSTIAASSLIFASNELFPQQYSILRASITACEYLDEEILSKCFDLMQETVRMEAKELMIDTSFLSSDCETPVSVLERSTKRQRI